MPKAPARTQPTVPTTAPPKAPPQVAVPALVADQHVWRFPLPNTMRGTLSVPRGATFISAELTPKGIQVWAEVTPGKPEVDVRFALVPTGLQPIPHGFAHLKTLMIPGGIILHVYLEQLSPKGITP